VQGRQLGLHLCETCEKGAPPGREECAWRAGLDLPAPSCMAPTALPLMRFSAVAPMVCVDDLAAMFGTLTVWHNSELRATTHITAIPRPCSRRTPRLSIQHEASDGRPALVPGGAGRAL